MFEFESHGDIDDMIKLEKELFEHLGFGDTFKQVQYDEASQRYNKLNDELGYEEEKNQTLLKIYVQNLLK